METQAMRTEKQQHPEGFQPRPSATAGTTEPTVYAGNTEATEAVADGYPHGARLAAIVLSLMLGMFLVSLDNVGGYVPLPAHSPAD